MSDGNCKDIPKESKEFAKKALTVVEGIGTAHGQEIIHCDVTPNNVFIDNAGNRKLADFGFAKIMKPKIRTTDPARACLTICSGSGKGETSFSLRFMKETIMECEICEKSCEKTVMVFIKCIEKR